MARQRAQYKAAMDARRATAAASVATQKARMSGRASDYAHASTLHENAANAHRAANSPQAAAIHDEHASTMHNAAIDPLRAHTNTPLKQGPAVFSKNTGKQLKQTSRVYAKILATKASIHADNSSTIANRAGGGTRMAHVEARDAHQHAADLHTKLGQNNKASFHRTAAAAHSSRAAYAPNPRTVQKGEVADQHRQLAGASEARSKALEPVFKGTNSTTADRVKAAGYRSAEANRASKGAISTAQHIKAQGLHGTAARAQQEVGNTKAAAEHHAAASKHATAISRAGPQAIERAKGQLNRANPTRDKNGARLMRQGNESADHHKSLAATLHHDQAVRKSVMANGKPSLASHSAAAKAHTEAAAHAKSPDLKAHHLAQANFHKAQASIHAVRIIKMRLPGPGQQHGEHGRFVGPGKL